MSIIIDVNRGVSRPRKPLSVSRFTRNPRETQQHVSAKHDTNADCFMIIQKATMLRLGLLLLLAVAIRGDANGGRGEDGGGGALGWRQSSGQARGMGQANQEHPGQSIQGHQGQGHGKSQGHQGDGQGQQGQGQGHREAQADGSALQRLLAAMSGHRARHAATHLLRSRHVRRAMYLGDTERLRSFVRRMAEGERLTVALVGGSITVGMGAVAGEPSYGAWLASWFEEVAPLPTTETGHTGAGAGDQQGPGAELGPHGAAAAAAGAGVGGRALGGAAAASGPRGGWLGVVGGGWSTSSVRVVNAGCPATSSAYMNLCLREYLPYDVEPDLVVVEYAINDPPYPEPQFLNEPRKSLELLLRKLLSLPRRPAVVLLNAYRWREGNPMPGMPRDVHGIYYSNAESQYFEFATYYGLPLLSLKAAAYHQMVGGAPGFQVHELRYKTRGNETYDKAALFYEDEMHPSGLTGHKVLSELLIGLLTTAAHSLVARPWKQAEELLAREPLPPCLIPGNVDTAGDRCVLGDKLRELAVGAQGFEWVNEGKDPRVPKWGMTASAPGATIAFPITPATAAAAAAAQAGEGSGEPDGHSTAAGGGGQSMLVILAYLRSYEHMGIADVRCEGRCVCGQEAVDTWQRATGAGNMSSGAAATAAEAAAQGPGPRPPAARLDGHWDTLSSQLQLGCFPAVLLPPGAAGAGADAAAVLPSGGGVAAAGAGPAGQGGGGGAAGEGAGEGGAGGGCWVRVTVSGETSSGSHKVRIGGLMVSHSAPGLAAGMCRDNLEAAQRAAGYRER